ncbi:MAG TPA: hypothetical protein VE959_00280 [Bryobacteraceae bacterium]|nr:hypothetical protein [Bryobacteraceae bacterium]
MRRGWTNGAKKAGAVEAVSGAGQPPPGSFRPVARIDFTDPLVRRLCLLAIAAAVFKLTMALCTQGTNDITSFWMFHFRSRQMGAIPFFHADPLYNHPPFVLNFLHLWAALQDFTGLRFGFWMRLSGTLADAGSLYLVYQISRCFLGERFRFAPLALMAISPVSLFVTGFHGNTDPFVVFFLLLAVYYASVKGQFWLAGAAFGMSCSIKVWPLVLSPVMFFYLKDWSSRFRFFLLAGAVIFLGSCPYILQDPDVLAARVLGYNSAPGCWGITRVLSFRSSWLMANMAYIRNGRYYIIVLILLVSYLLNRRQARPPLFAQFGFAVFLFLALTPGFGVQYLSWLVPWLAWAGLWYGVAFNLLGGTFLFLVYTYWSKGLPWDFANAAVGPWGGTAIVFELLTWGLVVLYSVLSLAALWRGQAQAVALIEERHSPQFKAQVALEAIRGKRPLSEIAAQFHVEPEQIKHWRTLAIERLDRLFADDRRQ